MANAGNTFTHFRSVIETAEPPLLGPQGRPGTLPVAELDARLDQFFKQARVSSHVQSLLRSAALLWHDHLDASHQISQGIETRDGSWLHGIMHRREPDFGNAKYWFRRVGQHDAFPLLAQRVAELLHNDTVQLTQTLIENGEWMPMAFVDECERAERKKDAARIRILRQVQAAEFDVLVAHILSRA